MRGKTIAAIALWLVATSGFLSLAFFYTYLAMIPGALWLVATIYGLSSIGYKVVAMPFHRVGWFFGRIAAIGIFAPLISTIRPDLENENRMKILAYLKQNPGASIQEVRGAAGVAWGTAVYHLDRLRRQEAVVSHRHGNHHRYWVKDTPEARVRRGWSVLEQSTARDVAMAVVASPGAHQGAICEAVNIRAPSASKHLSRLERHGLVEKHRVSRYTVYQPTPELERILEMQAPTDPPLAATPA